MLQPAVVAAVLVVLAAQALPLFALRRLPEHERLRGRVRSLRQSFARRAWFVKAFVAAVTGVTGVGGLVVYYGRARLTSRALVSTVAAVDVVLLAYVLACGLWHHRQSRHVPRGGICAVVSLLLVAPAVLVTRTFPNCEVLHPFDEPPISSSEFRPSEWHSPASHGPFRPPMPPPLVRPGKHVAPPPPPSAPSLVRIPPVTPPPTVVADVTPVGGCIMHRRPL